MSDPSELFKRRTGRHENLEPSALFHQPTQARPRTRTRTTYSQEMVQAVHHRQGISETEASKVARRTMGNVMSALEDSRAQWNFAWLESLLLDFRFSWRSFRRTPVFACGVSGRLG